MQRIWVQRRTLFSTARTEYHRRHKAPKTSRDELKRSREELQNRYTSFEQERQSEPPPHENRASKEELADKYAEKAKFRFDPSSIVARSRTQRPANRDAIRTRHKDPLAFPHRDPAASRRRDSGDPGRNPDPFGLQNLAKLEETMTKPHIRNPLPILTKAGVKKASKLSPTRQPHLSVPFSSPPLLPGFLPVLKEICASSNPTPTHIQSLALSHVLESLPCPPSETQQFRQFLQSRRTNTFRQFLLASETGSGKSIAYLLPVLQSVKLSELATKEPPSKPSSTPINPRALILAPTHELARQLSTFAKSLIHEVKLRVLCASKPNVTPNTPKVDIGSHRMSARRMKHEVQALMDGSDDASASHVLHHRDADILVATPMKALEMLRGRGWERALDNPLREGDIEPSNRWTTGRPEMGAANLDWVVIDEADVLFDPDFQATTRLLLSTISEQRDRPQPFTKDSVLSVEALSLHQSSSQDMISNTLSSSSSPLHVGTKANPPSNPTLSYPFNLILSTATIPLSLSTYLRDTHPNMLRLESDHVHKLPGGLNVEFVTYTPGQKHKEVESMLRRIWSHDHVSQSTTSSGPVDFSQVLIFVNKSSKVEELGKFLEEKGIKNVALTSEGEARSFGSNRHLEGFLKDQRALRVGLNADTRTSTPSPSFSETPHVLITTSLLSRGLDFGKQVRYVFVMDEPRNMIDFIHRAGRTARQRNTGTVVLFGKGSKSRLGDSVSALFGNTSGPPNAASTHGRRSRRAVVSSSTDVRALRGTRLGEVRKKVLSMV